jgi:hypothetical protein
LYNQESLKAGTDEYHDNIQKIIEHLRPHTDGEEQNDFPLLEPLLGTDGSKKAAASFQRTKKFVPTRYAIFLTGRSNSN